MKIIDVLTAWDGAKRGDLKHKEIVDAYNSFLPHPRGYRLTYGDDYCAATVSAAAILCGLTEVIPIECSCGEQMREYQSRGRWVEADDYTPKVGDQVFYCWTDGKNYAETDCTGAPNHTGLVTAVNDKVITVFEGNMGSDHRCSYRCLRVNDRYIRGYGVPEYPDPVLVRGATGASVKALQTMLNTLGFALEVDGSFGPATEKAWNEYILRYLTEKL